MNLTLTKKYFGVFASWIVVSMIVIITFIPIAVLIRDPLNFLLILFVAVLSVAVCTLIMPCEKHIKLYKWFRYYILISKIIAVNLVLILLPHLILADVNYFVDFSSYIGAKVNLTLAVSSMVFGACIAVTPCVEKQYLRIIAKMPPVHRDAILYSRKTVIYVISAILIVITIYGIILDIYGIDKRMLSLITACIAVFILYCTLTDKKKYLHIKTFLDKNINNE